jgi:hypothetical protein
MKIAQSVGFIELNWMNSVQRKIVRRAVFGGLAIAAPAVATIITTTPQDGVLPLVTAVVTVMNGMVPTIVLANDVLALLKNVL